MRRNPPARHLIAGTDEADATQLVLTSLELCNDYAVRALELTADQIKQAILQQAIVDIAEITACVTGKQKTAIPSHPTVFHEKIKQLLEITAAEAEKNIQRDLYRGVNVSQRHDLRAAAPTDDDYLDNAEIFDDNQDFQPHYRAFLTSPTNADLAGMDSRVLVTMWHNDLKLLTTALAALTLLQTFKPAGGRRSG